jgi:acetyltransferase (GNAT) family protein
MTAAQEQLFPFSDLALSRRLEMAEAHGNVEFVETRARINPASGAQWIQVAGAYAMFDGVKSPCTQTFGLGLFQPITPAEIQTIEEFYLDRGAPVFHEVSPLADPTLLPLLNGRGYHPVELTSVMFCPISNVAKDMAPLNEDIRVRLAQDNEAEMWAATAVKGWGELAELEEVMPELALVSAKRSRALSFVAEVDGQPIATGAMSISDGVALLAGASTIPEARRRGAQLALLKSRSRYAAEQGCDIVMVCAGPGGESQRNAERQGFRIAYTRIKWHLAQQA